MDAATPHYLRGRDGVWWLKLTSDEVKTLDVSGDGRNVELILRFLLAWQSVLADGPKHLSGQKPLKLFASFQKRCLAHPLVETITTFAKLGDLILKSSKMDDLTGPFILGMLDTPVAKEYILWHRTRNPELLTYLMTFLWFGKKLEIDDPQLQLRALRSWREVEDRLSTIEFPTKLTSDLHTIVSSVLPDPDLSNLFPSHGPGSTAEQKGRSLSRKNRALRYNARLDRAFVHSQTRKMAGVCDRPSMCKPWQPNAQAHLEYLLDSAKWVAGKYSANLRSSTVSKLLFVPKTIRIARSICKEPTTFMYFQQLVHRAFRRAFDTSVIGRFIRLEDQERNQILSGLGSELGHLDTIDLAAASDSVSWTLVRRVFPRKWLRYLRATRTSTVSLPDGTITKVNKFAPMGSACCFPVQSILFCSVVLYSYIKAMRGSADLDAPVTEREVRLTLSRIDDTGTRSVSETGFMGSVAVYGDDIICDSRVTPHVITTLTSLGFVVNVDKSFTGDQCVRESCGAYWWNGHNITPMLFRVSRMGEYLQPEDLASIVACANNAGSRGLKSLQLLAIRWSLFDQVHPDYVRRDRSKDGLDLRPWSPKTRVNPIRFSLTPDDALTLVVKHPVNAHLHNYYDAAYQYSVNRIWVLSTEMETNAVADGTVTEHSGKTGKSRNSTYCYSDEHYAYLRWWSTISSVDSTRDNTPRRVGRTSVLRVKLSWASIPAMECTHTQ